MPKIPRSPLLAAANALEKARRSYYDVKAAVDEAAGVTGS